MKIVKSLNASLFLSLFFLSLSAHANSQDVLSVSDNKDSQRADVMVNSNNGQITGMQVKGHSYSLDEIADGVTLVSKLGFSVIILQGQVDSSQRGSFTMRYLTSLPDNYESCNFQLVPDSNGWHVVNSSGRSVQSAEVIEGDGGVSTINGICG